MLEPTSGVTASQYWNAIKSGNPVHVQMVFADQNITLDDSDIDLNGGLIINDTFNSDTDLVLGKAVSKQLSITILNSAKVADLIWTGEFELRIGVEIGNSTKYVTIGYFKGENPNNSTTVESINFVAYDRMRQFDILVDNFAKNARYPLTIEEIYEGLCNFVGVGISEGDPLPIIYQRTFNYAPTDFSGYTCRDILAWIAEACGCYARIDSTGKCKLLWYEDNTSYTVTENEEYYVENSDYSDGLPWDDADLLTWDELDEEVWDNIAGTKVIYGIDQILLKDDERQIELAYPSAYGENPYLISGNPFLDVTSMQEFSNYIVPIYNRMVALGGCLPIQVDAIGNWLVESGDIITIETKGLSIEMPVFTRVFRWNGAVNDSYETTGRKQRDVYANDKLKQRSATGNAIRNSAAKVLAETSAMIAVEGQKILMAAQEEIQLVVEDYYHKQSGITIDPNGVDITGSKYVQIHSGGQFDVESTNFKIDSTNKKMEIGKVRIDEIGFHNWEVNGNNIEGELIVGSYSNAQVGNHPIVTLRSYAVPDMGGTGNDYMLVDFAFAGTNCPSDDYTSDLWITSNWDRNAQGYPQNITLWATGGSIGDQYRPWEEAWIKELNYTSQFVFSSRDVKHDIKSLKSVGEKLDKLRPVTFIYDDDAKERVRTGLIYEETVDVLPEICTQDEGKKGINYMDLVPMLLKEIQDLRKRVEELERRQG